MITKESLIDTADDICPVCKGTKYLNPAMKLFVSPCYHRMCDSCVDRIFSHGSAPCPICRTTLRKSNFVIQTFEDLTVEKECRIRKIIHKYMNKVLEDFPNLKTYNDYLESVEDYTFKLLSNIDVQQVYAELEQFKLENKEIIHKNMMKQMKEEKSVSNHLAKEKEEKRKRKEEEELLNEEEMKKKLQEKEDFINEMATSDQPASLLLAKKQSSSSSSSSSQTLSSLRPSSMRSLPTTLKPSSIGLAHASALGDFSFLDEDASTFSEEQFASFDPLENAFSSPISVSLLDRYYDPMIEGWIDSLPIRAGGSHDDIYHLKAIQSAYSDLLYNINDDSVVSH